MEKKRSLSVDIAKGIWEFRNVKSKLKRSSCA